MFISPAKIIIYAEFRQNKDAPLPRCVFSNNFLANITKSLFFLQELYTFYLPV